MASGTRYSRWAVYAGFVAIGTLLNFLAMPVLKWRSASPASPWRLHRDWGLPIQIALTCSILAGLPLAIVSVVLGTSAIRALRRSPRLRGTGLARFALTVGWWVIVVELFVYLLFSGMRQWIGN